jgi:UDP-N-acetylmuramoylalanine--D-glutamate ligase
MDYAGKQVLVLGLGESGLAMARWLARCGAALRVADTRENPERLAELREALPNAEFVGGTFEAALLDGIDFIAVSPGLAPDRELAAIGPTLPKRIFRSGAKSSCSRRRCRHCMSNAITRLK